MPDLWMDAAERELKKRKMPDSDKVAPGTGPEADAPPDDWKRSIREGMFRDPRYGMNAIGDSMTAENAAQVGRTAMDALPIAAMGRGMNGVVQTSGAMYRGAHPAVDSAITTLEGFLAPEDVALLHAVRDRIYGTKAPPAPPQPSQTPPSPQSYRREEMQ